MCPLFPVKLSSYACENSYVCKKKKQIILKCNNICLIFKHVLGIFDWEKLIKDIEVGIIWQLDWWENSLHFCQILSDVLRNLK